eukprot:scaffold196669_cov28-Tisochrysis_lutea.AAC.9
MGLSASSQRRDTAAGVGEESAGPCLTFQRRASCGASMAPRTGSSAAWSRSVAAAAITAARARLGYVSALERATDTSCRTAGGMAAPSADSGCAWKVCACEDSSTS